MMNPEDFELLLAMMRQLKLNDSNGLSLEDGIVKIIDNFEVLFTPQQKQAISKEFARYEQKLQERKRRKEIEDEIEQETYDKLLNEFFLEEVF